MFMEVLAEPFIFGVIFHMVEDVVQEIQEVKLSSARSSLSIFIWEVIDVLAETGQVLAESSCSCG